MAHAISYGWYSHDQLFYIDEPCQTRSIDEIAQGIVGIIKLSVSPELSQKSPLKTEQMQGWIIYLLQ